MIVTSLFNVSCNLDQTKNLDNKDSSEETGEHAGEIAFTTKQAKDVGLKTEIVKLAPFSNVIKTSGQVLSPQGDEHTIVSTTSGIVSFVNNDIVEGYAVRAGWGIVTISSKNLQEGDPILKAKITFETAEKEYKRAESLVTDKIISTKEFEQIRLRYETAKAAYQGQAANITSLGVRVVSPINGYIKNRLVKQGDYVSVGQPIATVTKNKRMQLRAEVSENYFRQLRTIVSANFKTAYDEKLYKLSEMNGRLLSYGKTTNNSSFYIPVIFEFDNIGDIVSGSFAEIYLLSTTRMGVISIPISALTEEQGLNYIYLQVEPEAYIKREVVVGERNGERVEITSGLKDGEVVVVKGVTQIKLASASGAVPEGHNH